MIRRWNYAMLGGFLAVVLVSPMTVEAAPGGGSRSSSAFNDEDMYYDYEVWKFDNALAEWYLWGTFDTYQEAEFYAFKLSLHGWFPVRIEKVNALSPYQAIQ